MKVLERKLLMNSFPWQLHCRTIFFLVKYNPHIILQHVFASYHCWQIISYGAVVHDEYKWTKGQTKCKEVYLLLKEYSFFLKVNITAYIEISFHFVLHLWRREALLSFNWQQLQWVSMTTQPIETVGHNSNPSCSKIHWSAIGLNVLNPYN